MAGNDPHSAYERAYWAGVRSDEQRVQAERRVRELDDAHQRLVEENNRFGEALRGATAQLDCAWQDVPSAVARLLTAIEDAPHGKDCCGALMRSGVRFDCTCWKARAVGKRHG